MSEKAECPGCHGYTSDIARALTMDEACPHCGLSAQAMVEIRRVWRSHADERLKQQLTKTLQRADAAEREAGRLRMIVDEVREALEAERV